jgi:Ca-activated chloride channel family protein
MEYNDLDETRSRLDVVKEVVRNFAVRRMTDREGAADNIALITFAHYPKLVCPFTLDVDAMTGFIDSLDIVRNRQAEDGTAIGVGLAKAVAILKGTDAHSKVVVLLTDGENNVDDITPAEAAKLGAEIGARVYTVMAGRYVYQEDIVGRVYATERQLDSTDLEGIAKTTGGRFFRARDRAELESAYAEIEKLERTKRVEKRWSETYDLYLAWLVPALAAHLLAWMLGTTVLRRLP